MSLNKQKLNFLTALGPILGTLLAAMPALAAGPAPNPTSIGTRAFCEAFEAPDAPKFASCTAKDAGDPQVATAFEGAARLQHQCLELLNSALAAKHVKMDPVGARRCAAARQAFLQDPRRPPARRAAMGAACAAAFTGLQKTGERCESALDCAAGLACAGQGGGPPGTCAEPAKPGADCSGDAVNGSAVATLFGGLRAVCAAGAHCNGTACAADLGAKAKCSGTDADACGPGRRCLVGACAADLLGIKGDACSRPADCAAGFLCKNEACAPAATAGAKCSADDDCAGACRNGRCATRCGSK